MNNPLIAFSVLGAGLMVVALAYVIVVSYLHENDSEFTPIPDWKRNEIRRVIRPVHALECAKPGVVYDEYYDAFRRFDDMMAKMMPTYRKTLAEENARHERVKKEVAGSSDTVLYYLADLWDVFAKEETNA